MPPPVVEDRLVREVEDDFGRHLLEQPVEELRRVVAGLDAHVSVRGRAVGGQLLGAAGDEREHDVVAGGRDLGERRLDDRGIVLAVDYDDGADGVSSRACESKATSGIAA
jgi:hypothetical protein